MDLDLRGRELLDYLQSDGFSHADLYRRARRIHERRLRAAVAGWLRVDPCGGGRRRPERAL